MRQSFDEDLALWADLGIDHVGLISPKLDGPGWDECRQAVLEAGLRVSSLSCYREGIDESIEYSPTIGTKVLYIVAGRATAFPWEKAAEEWCEAMTPSGGPGKGTRAAPGRGADQPAPERRELRPLRPRRHRPRPHGRHRLRHRLLLVLVRAGPRRLVRENIDRLALVQIGDYKLGTFDTPNRCAIGDGDVPVERLLAMLLDAGYEGAFDLEILGPQDRGGGLPGPDRPEPRAGQRDAGPAGRLSR